MFTFISPEQAMKFHNTLNPKDTKPISYWVKLAKSNKKCEVCGQPAWKFGQTGLCFSCTTGEWDNSDDYELEP